MVEILMEGMTENKGGKETYMIHMFQVFNKNKYNFTFVAYNEKIAYEDYLIENGATIFHLPPRCTGLLQHRKALDKLFKDKKYDVIWAHKTSLSACEILSIGKRNGVSVRIIHSHCSSNMGGMFTFLMHSINKRRIYGMANVYLACSNPAAKWFYGNHPAKIMINGVNLEEFRYDPVVREQIRNQLDLGDNFVIGHVGRFGAEKNHRKLLYVFHACKQRKKNVKLLLCGDGKEREAIERLICELKLEEDVKLLGIVDHVNQVLQAMDVMVMPSLFEGLPFSLLEAQTAGLKCIVSDAVSKESDVLKWNQFLSLNLEDDLWAETILMTDLDYDRLTGYRVMKQSGFDLEESGAAAEKMICLRLQNNRRY